MQITENHFQNKDQLEEIWNNTFNLAMNYAKEKLNDVVDILGQRLLNIGKYESAAEIYESVALYDKAIDAFV